MVRGSEEEEVEGRSGEGEVEGRSGEGEEEGSGREGRVSKGKWGGKEDGVVRKGVGEKEEEWEIGGSGKEGGGRWKCERWEEGRG